MISFKRAITSSEVFSKVCLIIFRLNITLLKSLAMSSYKGAEQRNSKETDDQRAVKEQKTNKKNRRDGAGTAWLTKQKRICARKGTDK